MYRCALLVAVLVTVVAGCHVPARPFLSRQEACEKGDIEQVRSRLYWDRGLFSDINDPLDKTGRQMIHVAVKHGHAALTLWLIEHGARVNSPGDWGWDGTPLHIAAQQGHVAVAAVLLAKGADVNALGKSNKTPLDVAENAGRTDVVNLLKEFGACRADAAEK